MPPDPHPREVILRWMRSAPSDLAWARAPLPPGGDREQACFHAQQAVEKALKALLLSAGIEFPFTHNLQRLAGLLPEEGRADPAILASTGLTDYAVHARYPGEDDPVDEREHREAVDLAAAAMERIEGFLARGVWPAGGSAEA